jgi:hypothetical protein
MATIIGLAAVFLHYAVTGHVKLFRGRSYDVEHEFIEQVISDLRSKSPEELRSLPWGIEYEGPNDQVRYIQRAGALRDGSFRVVIQAYKKRFLGKSRIAATGFQMLNDGSISELSESEIDEYL